MNNKMTNPNMCGVDYFTVSSHHWYYNGYSMPPYQNGRKGYHEWVRLIGTPFGITVECWNSSPFDRIVFKGAKVICAGRIGQH